jgi:hypothetical protein
VTDAGQEDHFHQQHQYRSIPADKLGAIVAKVTAIRNMMLA